ncbi:MAG TPA: hypothetical protein VF961_08530, partial [Pyrinomonadaceae bacterium]
MNRRQFNFGLLGAAGAFAFRDAVASTTPRVLPARGPRFAPGSAPQLRVNGPRIVEHINALAEFGKNPQGGVSRVAYSEADR